MFMGITKDEIIRIVEFILLCDIPKNINESHYYSITADEVTDRSNVELLVLWFRWVDAYLYVHEDFVEINAIKNIKSDSIAVVVKDVITRFSISLSNCCR